MHTVLFVESGTSGGGSFLSLKLLVDSLDKTRFRPVVVFLNRTRFYEEFRQLGVDTRLVFDAACTTTLPWGIRKRFEHLADRAHTRPKVFEDISLWLAHGSLLRSLRRIVREEQVDLLYSNNNVHRNVFMPMLARQTGLPLVCHLRSMGKETYTPRRKEYTDRAVSQYVAISEVVRDNWLEEGLEPGKVHLINNGLPAMTDAPLDLASEFGVPAGDKVIGIIARVTWEKGHDLLFRAFQLLRQTRPEVSLVVAGDGPKLAELKALAQELGQENKIYFLGYESRAHALVQSLDVLAQPSRTDPFSRSVLEAMQVGVPTVTTAVGGIFELIEDGVNGLLVPVGDETALARALERLLTDQALRTQLVDNALDTVQERFDLARQTRKIEAVMDQALSGQDGRQASG